MDAPFQQCLVRHCAACSVLFIYRKKYRFFVWVKNGWYSIQRLLKKQLLTDGHRHAADHRANGKIAIQALVNTMGVSVAAAFAVVNRIDDFAITPEQNIAHAMTALMAQNKGAGKNDRMREGFRCG